MDGVIFHNGTGILTNEWLAYWPMSGGWFQGQCRHIYRTWPDWGSYNRHQWTTCLCRNCPSCGGYSKDAIKDLLASRFWICTSSWKRVVVISRWILIIRSITHRPVLFMMEHASLSGQKIHNVNAGILTTVLLQMREMHKVSSSITCIPAMCPCGSLSLLQTGSHMCNFETSLVLIE